MNVCAVTHRGQPHLIVGAHGGACPGQACDGCLEATALSGLYICSEDLETIRNSMRELPELWAALAEPSTTTPSAGVDDTTRALPAVVDARSQIRAALVTWCRRLEDTYGVPLPDETLIARWTRLEILRAEWDRDVELDAWRRPVDAGRRADHHRAAAGHAEIAKALRERRLGDVDVIDALREHVDRHLPTLLGDTPGQADDLAADIARVHSRARALAYPRRAAVPIPCSCGATVRLDTDPKRTYTCPGCGRPGTLDDWRRWEAPEAGEPLPLSRLAGWLARVHGLEVTVKQLRGWRDRDHITPMRCCILPGAAGPHRPGCEQVFDPTAVMLIARSRLDGRRTA